MAPAPFALAASRLFTGESFLKDHALVVEGRLIKDILPRGELKGLETTRLEGATLAPGWIDLQVNGGGNVLFNNEPTQDGVRKIAAAHLAQGTTKLLPTCISGDLSLRRDCLAAVREAKTTTPSILGIHFEGPHLNPEMGRIHARDAFGPPGAEDLALYHAEDGELIFVTLAPEALTPESIAAMTQGGAVVSIGHTRATRAQIEAAVAAGATNATHLLNAMGPLSARDPGPAGVLLNMDSVSCGIIADGVHVGDDMLRLALRAKPKGTLYLVSDAQAPAGAASPAPFFLGKDEIFPEGERCVNKEGRLAGSMMTLGEIVARLWNDPVWCGKNTPLGQAEILRMASTYPARAVGREATLGRLAPGFLADILALTPQARPFAVWSEGQEAFFREKDGF